VIIRTSWSQVRCVALLAAALVVQLGCGNASPATAPSFATTPSLAAASTTSQTAVATTPPAASASPSPAVVGGVCVPEPVRFDPNDFVPDGTEKSAELTSHALTGAWAGDDGGIYYLRALGSTVWWNGMSSHDDPPASLGRNWNNVARGEIQKDLTIAVDWADVPRGGVDGHGTLKLKIAADSAGALQITKIDETGTGFGNTLWTRCAAGFP
jgi:hypothetical protein